MGKVSETDSTILPVLFFEAESKPTLCWYSTVLFLLTPFVWTMNEFDTLPIVPLSESDTLSILPLSTSHEVMS